MCLNCVCFFPGETILLEDYAENRKALFADGEVKSAHFGKGQYVLHPIVCYRKQKCGQLARYTLMYMSDDIEKSHHHVHHFTEDALQKVLFLHIFSL